MCTIVFNSPFLTDCFLNESQFCFIKNHFFYFYRLSDAINDAIEWALEESVIHAAQQLLSKLEMTQDLLNETTALAMCLPVRSQSTYVHNAHKLERTICRAEKIQVADSLIQISRDLIQRYVRARCT